MIIEKKSSTPTSDRVLRYKWLFCESKYDLNMYVESHQAVPRTSSRWYGRIKNSDTTTKQK